MVLLLRTRKPVRIYEYRVFEYRINKIDTGIDSKIESSLQKLFTENDTFANVFIIDIILTPKY